MSRFTLTGMPVSPPDAYQGGPVRAQGLGSDADGNIWISSFKNNSVYVFIHGNPHQPVDFRHDDGAGPFDVAIATDGTAWVSHRWTPLGELPRSIAKYALVNGTLQQQFLHFLPDATAKGRVPRLPGKRMARCSGRPTWIYAFRPDGTELGQL